MFDEILPAYHTQQHTLQLQSIAHHHSVPLTYSNSGHGPSSTQVTPAATPSSANISLPFVVSTPVSATPLQATPNPKKRAEPPLTPAASVDGSEPFLGASLQSTGSLFNEAGASSADTPAARDADKIQEPPKKKRRVALTHVGDLGS